MAIIKSISAHEILDSRGNPTIETTIVLDSGITTTSSIPSGASTSSYEAFELRDGDQERYEGKGVLKACSIVNTELSGLVVGKNPLSQKEIDQSMIELDGTENKSKLGGNSILSVSQAVVKAAALSQNLKLWEYIHEMSIDAGVTKLLPANSSHMPTPTFNIINGGLHGGGNLNIQEFHVTPSIELAYSKALEIGQEVYEKLKEILTQRNLVHSIGDEGGFAPNLESNTEALELILEAIKFSGNKPFEEVFLGIDASASNIVNNGIYKLKERETGLSSEDWISFLVDLTQKYHLLFIEDGIEENDWNSWTELTERVGSKTMIVGDDLLATNAKRLQKAIDEKAATAILVKPNQAGTISETIQVIKLAKENNWKTIASHRSGETNETFIADFAVGVGADYVKFGAPARGERVAKYNRLLEIERELGF